MLRYLTSGESHGKCLIAILEGVPAGLIVDRSKIDEDLAARMSGYGRGKRMGIESDRAQILSGLRRSKTIGSPVAMMIQNVDQSIDRLPAVLEVRPGHADLPGLLKYDLKDARDVLERASARETAGRVAVGAVCKMLLSEFAIKTASHVIAIGAVEAKTRNSNIDTSTKLSIDPERSRRIDRIVSLAGRSPVRCSDPKASSSMCREIDKAAKDGDTLGGVFEVIVSGLPPGLGSYAQWDRRMGANLARAVMSIQAVKAVGFGPFLYGAAKRRGSSLHDEIFYDRARGFFRKTNNAGGIEGGMTNGEDLVMQAVMKPISTLRKPLASVNIKTKKAVKAAVERSDVCALPAAAVIGEAVVAIEIAAAMCEKFGGDSLREMRRNYLGYIEQIRRF